LEDGELPMNIESIDTTNNMKMITTILHQNLFFHSKSNNKNNDNLRNSQVQFKDQIPKEEKR
jgi:hypothetical protein